MAWLRLQAVAAVLALLAAAGVTHSFEFHEATVDAIQLGFRNGSLTSAALVRFYLDQIRRMNPLLHAVIEVNPDALRQAARADAERRRGMATGALHGVPVLLKDNIATCDALNTTAGSLALLGSVVKRDAGVAARLRRAGAVVLGKASLSEWANFRNVHNGWSARGGQTRNPPMCRTVSDAVHVLDAIVGYDKLDAAATRTASKYIPRGGYLQFL
uniref:Amidase domain-containing protein n=1 Tax=Aegilops tauschii subsp. strangulata TaxID=200361 RepID=A0A453A9Z0_AEGTS